MKILMVNKFLYPNGGSETYIFELGKELVRQGHEVQYFGMEHPDMVVGNNVGAYTSNIDFHGGNKLAKLLAPLKIIYSFEARRQIRKVLDDFKPDVVHLNNINFQITPSIIYEIRAWDKEKNCKIVFTAHDYQWICPNHMLYIPQRGEVCEQCRGGKYIECTKNSCIHGSKARSLIGTIEAYYYKLRKTYGMVDTIICPSRFLFDKFAEDPILRDKLVMMHNFLIVKKDASEEKQDAKKISSDVCVENGVDKNDYSGVVDNNANSEGTRNLLVNGKELPTRYALYFGRYDVQKGIKTLIEVCKELSGVEFVFAGSGPLEDELSNISNIKNVGFQSGEALRKLISNAEFSIYPSEWYENCPFSVMESQMYGTPVIGADIGGIPELIGHDGESDTGILFDAGDKDVLKNKILSLWNDTGMINKMQASCGDISFDGLEKYTKEILEKIY